MHKQRNAALTTKGILPYTCFFLFLPGIEPVLLLPRLLWGGGLDRLAMTPGDDM